MLHCSSTTCGAWHSATVASPPCPPPSTGSGKSTPFCAVKYPPSCALPSSSNRQLPLPTPPRCWLRCAPGKTSLHDCSTSPSCLQLAVAGRLRHPARCQHGPCVPLRQPLKTAGHHTTGFG